MGTLLSFLFSFLIGGSAPFLASIGVDTSLAWEGEGLTFKYDEQFQSQTLPEGADESGVLASFFIEEPPILLMVREEEGLRKVASVAQQSVREYLRGEVERQLPKRYPNYEAKGNGELKVDDFDAFYFDFEYHQDETEEKATQRFVVIPVSDDKAVYASIQVRSYEFEKHVKKLERLLDSMDVK